MIASYKGAIISLAQTAAVLGVFVFALVSARRDPIWRERLRRIVSDRAAAVATMILLLFVAVAVLDSVMWPRFEERGGEKVRVEDLSLLDRFFTPAVEETLSAPLARETFEGHRSEPLKERHLLGTNLNGRDVLLMALKGCRTALIIGGLTVLVAIPLGILFGLLAGYFGGKTDDAVTYLFSTLESIPEILLLICLMKLMGQGLFQLCLALGITTWVGLCRVVRGETLKIRELPYVRAARALGAGHFAIIRRHILPNVMHIVLIAAILRFSGLVMAEAILSYLGIGVEAGTGSWGAMIDQARDDLARHPVVWWNITAAGTLLFVLVLASNILGDRVRDVLDPRLRGKD